MERALEERDRDLLMQPVEEPEFYYAANLLSSEGTEEDTKSLNVGEFMLFQLIRLGLTNPNQLEEFRKDFLRLDKAGKGKIDLDVFKANNLASNTTQNKVDKYGKQHVFGKIARALITPKKHHGEHRVPALPKKAVAIKPLSATKAETLRRLHSSNSNQSNLDNFDKLDKLEANNNNNTQHLYKR